MRDLKLPAGACDAHVHVFRPDVYPYAKDRAYTPGRITVGQLQRFLDAHGLRRVVLVQPSVYGTDNRAMLDAMAALGRRRVRGIAVVDLPRIKDRELAELEAAGVVGLRLNATSREHGDLGRLLRAADKRLAGTDWHLQVYAPLPAIAGAQRTIMKLDRPVVLDHFAGARTGDPALDRGLRVLTRLLTDGAAFVKLSAAYRVSVDARRRWRNAAPLAEKLIEAAPHRLVWGSDWPHTAAHGGKGRGASARVLPFQRIDDRTAIAALADWAGSRAMLKRILVETPARLYQFGSANPPRPSFRTP